MWRVEELEARLVPAGPALVRLDQSDGQVIVAGQSVDDDRVRIFGGTGSLMAEFQAFEAGYTAGVRVASAEFTGDGMADVVAGIGPGEQTRFRLFDGATQNLITEQGVYEPSFVGGIFVAAADVTGDGAADVITSPDLGGGARIRVFDGKSFEVVADFFGIEDPNFRGGARVGAGDVNGDGTADLLVGAGFGGGPRVAVFDGSRLVGTPDGELPPKLFGDFFVFEQTLRNGVFVSAGDVTGDGKADLVVGAGPGGGPRVFGLDGGLLSSSKGSNQTQILNFFGGNPEARQGIRVAVKDLDGDAQRDVVIGSSVGFVTQVVAYPGGAIPENGVPPGAVEITAFGTDYFGGAFVG